MENNKPDVTKNLDKASVRFLISFTLIIISAPLAFVPLLKTYGRGVPTNKFLIWLWDVMPGFHTNGDSLLSGKMITAIGAVMMVFFIRYAYKAHKSWEKMEKIKDEAEKRVLIDDFVKKKAIK